MSNSALTDAQLVQKSLEDVSFFGVLVERYEQKMLFYIMRISSFEMHDAEEILQDVFVKVWKNLRDYDEDVPFSAWIYRIARNETISSFRKWKTRGKDQQVVWDENHVNELLDDTDIEENVDKLMNKKFIQEVLATLSDKYREVLVLRFFEDLSYEEISEVLRRPAGTVATLINRAKHSFKESFLRLQK